MAVHGGGRGGGDAPSVLAQGRDESEAAAYGGAAIGDQPVNAGLLVAMAAAEAGTRGGGFRRSLHGEEEGVEDGGRNAQGADMGEAEVPCQQDISEIHDVPDLLPPPEDLPPTPDGDRRSSATDGCRLRLRAGMVPKNLPPPPSDTPGTGAGSDHVGSPEPDAELLAAVVDNAADVPVGAGEVAAGSVAEDAGESQRQDKKKGGAGKSGALAHLKEFLRQSHGSPLLAWMSMFDKNGDGKVDEEEFEQGLKEIGYLGDAKQLFRDVDDDGSGVLTMKELDSWSADLWSGFKRWCAQTFTSATDMVMKLKRSVSAAALARRGSIVGHERRGSSDEMPSFIKADFVENACRMGWYGLFEPLLYDSLDIERKGRVTAANIGWLEKERRLYLKRQNTKGKDQNGKAPIGKQRSNAVRALQSFVAFLRQRYGMIFAAWRKALDKDGSMSLTRKEIFKACTELAWAGDVAGLWHALDSEESGSCSLEDLSGAEGRALALFRKWAEDGYKSVKGGFNALVRARRIKNNPKKELDKRNFVAACASLNCSFQGDFVFDLLDYENAGAISFKDLKFMEDWKPAEYLTAISSQEESEAFRKWLLQKYVHPVKAWRLAMDLHNSGKASWKEFRRAAEKVSFPGDIAGAWLALDVHRQGFITLREIDAQAFEALSQFRSWAYFEFGSVSFAFKALDADESGYLTLKEFRKNLKKDHFRGEADALWSCFDVDGDGKVMVSEMLFIDEWEMELFSSQAMSRMSEWAVDVNAEKEELASVSKGSSRKPLRVSRRPSGADLVAKHIPVSGTLVEVALAAKRSASQMDQGRGKDGEDDDDNEDSLDESPKASIAAGVRQQESVKLPAGRLLDIVGWSHAWAPSASVALPSAGPSMAPSLGGGLRGGSARAYTSTSSAAAMGPTPAVPWWPPVSPEVSRLLASGPSRLNASECGASTTPRSGGAGAGGWGGPRQLPREGLYANGAAYVVQASSAAHTFAAGDPHEFWRPVPRREAAADGRGFFEGAGARASASTPRPAAWTTMPPVSSPRGPRSARGQRFRHTASVSVGSATGAET